MPRETCEHCLRPIQTCLCDYTFPIDNNIPVVIWQHPSEHQHPKGSAPLLLQSLSQCTLVSGEDISRDNLEELLGTNLGPDQNGAFHLLFPNHIDPSLQSHHSRHEAVKGLIVIDGTWRKARKILHLNPWLMDLPRIAIESHLEGLYKGFRKAESRGQLSTLEAVCQALEIIELNPVKYRPLASEFARYLNHLKSFRP